jgi:hypothetical protein
LACLQDNQYSSGRSAASLLVQPLPEETPNAFLHSCAAVVHFPQILLISGSFLAPVCATVELLIQFCTLSSSGIL